MFLRRSFFGGSAVFVGLLFATVIAPVHATIIENQPTVWWDFNSYVTYGTTTYCIDSAQGIWLSPYNGAVGILERSEGDYAADFSGGNATYATAASDTGLNSIVGAYAIELDVLIPEGTPAGQFLVSTSPSSNVNYRRQAVIYGFEGTELEMHANPRTDGGPTDLNDGQWHKVVIASYGNASGTEGWVDKIVYSVDGGALQTMTRESFVDDSSAIDLGRITLGTYKSGSTGNVFKGALDNFAVYDLSTSVMDWNGDIESQLDTAVLAIANDQQRVVSGTVPDVAQPELTAYSWAVLKDNPTFYYNFNEPVADQVACDSVRGQKNDRLTAMNGTTRTTGYSENLGQTAVFDGDSVFAAESVMDDGQMAGAYAIEFWMKDDSTSPGTSEVSLMNVVGKSSDVNCPSVIYGGYDYGKVELYADTNQYVGYDGPTIVDNDWHHVVMTYYGDGDTIGVTERASISVDGVVSSVDASLFSNRMDNRNQLILGAASAAGLNGFTGCIDELAIYDLSSMTESEISSKMTTLAGHYALASGSAETNLSYVDGNQITYTYDLGMPDDSYKDSTGRELVDGVCGSTRTFIAPDVVGVVAYDIDEEENVIEIPLQVTFDLSETTSLDSIWIDYTGGGLNFVDAPESVTISFSTDGINFGNAMTFDDFNNESFDGTDSNTDNDYRHNRRLIADVGSIDAAYVRLFFERAIETDSQWIAISEVQFITDTIETAWIPGDANKDGKVDGSDVTILAGNWQTLTDATWDMGDFNGDGKVDGSDVTILAGNWQSGVNTAAASVPEPSTISLLILLVITCFGFLRRKRSR